METLQMWDKVPGRADEIPVLEYYKAENRRSDGCVVIYPGGGYSCRAPHEGKGYAEFFNGIGMDAFVCEYRVTPQFFRCRFSMHAARSVMSGTMPRNMDWIRLRSL